MAELKPVGLSVGQLTEGAGATQDHWHLSRGLVLRSTASAITPANTGEYSLYALDTGAEVLRYRQFGGSERILVDLSNTQTLTNKTLGAGTTITLGSDATGDIYYRNAGGALTRLAIGLTDQVLTVASGVPTWLDPYSVASEIVVNSTGVTSGTNEYFLYNGGGVLQNAAELKRDGATGRIEIESSIASGASLYIKNTNATGFYAALLETDYSNAQTLRLIANGSSGQAFASATYGTSADAHAFLVQRYGATGTTAQQRMSYISQNFNGNTPGVGFGWYFTMAIKSSTTDDREAARFGVAWATATDASRQGYLTMHVTANGTEGQLAYEFREEEFRIYNGAGQYSGWQVLASGISANYTLRFPGAAPTNGDVMISDAGNFMKWVSMDGTKDIVIENPTSAEDISFFYTEVAITVIELNAVCVGTSPSVTWTIRHSTDRSATGNEVVSSGTTTTSTTTGTSVTSGFNDATIPAGSWVWLETTALTGTVNSLHVAVRFRRD